jgi:integrase
MCFPRAAPAPHHDADRCAPRTSKSRTDGACPDVGYVATRHPALRDQGGHLPGALPVHLLLRAATDARYGRDNVFVTGTGEPCDPENALRALTVAARRAGLEGVGLHTLRHSAASVVLSGGVPLNVVSRVLGHSGLSITADVYGHIAPDVPRNALDVLGLRSVRTRALHSHRATEP